MGLDSLKYKLYVFDNNGQTIQLIGYLVDTEIYEQPPIYNKQWCAAMCPYNQFMGYLDKKNKKYIGDESDIVSQIIYGNLSISIVNETTSHSETDNGLIAEFNYKMLIIIICVGITLCSSIFYCIFRCYKLYKAKGNIIINDETDKNDLCDQETQCLLPRKYQV